MKAYRKKKQVYCIDKVVCSIVFFLIIQNNILIIGFGHYIYICVHFYRYLFIIYTYILCIYEALVEMTKYCCCCRCSFKWWQQRNQDQLKSLKKIDYCTIHSLFHIKSPNSTIIKVKFTHSARLAHFQTATKFLSNFYKLCLSNG